MAGLDFWRGNRTPRNLGTWDLAREFDRMFEDMDRFLRPLRGEGEASETMPTMAPACNIEETENNYQLSFDLPGLKKDEIDIEVADGGIQVSGERKRETETGDSKQHRVERYYGQFRRYVALPDDADAENINASYENGVLGVTVPKSEKKKPKKIEISGGEGKTIEGKQAKSN